MVVKLQDGTVTKIVSIISLLCLYTVDALTWKIDHTITIAIVSMITGLAGYEVGIHAQKRKRR